MVGAYHYEDQWGQNRPWSTIEDSGWEAYMQFPGKSSSDRKSSGNILHVLLGDYKLTDHRSIPIGCTCGG